MSSSENTTCFKLSDDSIFTNNLSIIVKLCKQYPQNKEFNRILIHLGAKIYNFNGNFEIIYKDDLGIVGYILYRLALETKHLQIFHHIENLTMRLKEIEDMLPEDHPTSPIRCPRDFDKTPPRILM